MYAHLIWLTDLSDNAARCQPPLLALARALRADVSVVHALGGLSDGLPDMEARLRPQVEALADGLRAHGLAAHAVIGQGQPHELAASWTGAGELLVVGRTGVSTLERVLIGSTTRRVLDEAAAPVMVVGGRTVTQFERLLCPVELPSLEHPEPPCAVAEAAELAVALGARLTFSHVQSVGDATPPEETLDEVQAHVRSRLSPRLKETLKARYEIGRGETPEQALLQIAQQHDLLVMASRGRSGLARLVLGSVTDFMTRNAPIPVLVVREP